MSAQQPPQPPVHTCPSCHSAVPPQIVKRLSGAGVVVLVVGLLFCLVGALFALLCIEEQTVCPVCGYRYGRVLPGGIVPAARPGQLPAPAPSRSWSQSEKRFLAGVCALGVVLVVGAAIFNDATRTRPPQPVDRLAPLKDNQRVAVQRVIECTNELDTIFDHRGRNRNSAALYQAKLADATQEYYRAYSLLPKNDARMMMGNMIEAYTNIGPLLTAKKDDPTPLMAAARMRKVFLNHIVAGSVSNDERKILETLRRQDQ